MTTEKLQEQFGRLGNTPFYLNDLVNSINGELMLPVSELNKMRREIVVKLEELRSQPKRWVINENASLKNLLPAVNSNNSISNISDSANLIVLVRNLNQLEAALKTGITTIYCERRYIWKAI